MSNFVSICLPVTEKWSFQMFFAYPVLVTSLPIPHYMSKNFLPHIFSCNLSMIHNCGSLQQQ